MSFRRRCVLDSRGGASAVRAAAPREIRLRDGRAPARQRAGDARPPSLRVLSTPLRSIASKPRSLGSPCRGREGVATPPGRIPIGAPSSPHSFRRFDEPCSTLASDRRITGTQGLTKHLDGPDTPADVIDVQQREFKGFSAAPNSRAVSSRRRVPSPICRDIIIDDPDGRSGFARSTKRRAVASSGRLQRRSCAWARLLP
jgi:hypothetical protein